MKKEDMRDPVEICLEIEWETDHGYLVTDGTTKPDWIPKSQVELDEDGGPGDTVNFFMPEWLAIKKNFI